MKKFIGIVLLTVSTILIVKELFASHLASLNASNINSGTLQNARLDPSSVTLQDNTLSIATNVAQVNTIITSSATTWLPLDATTNTKVGGLTLNGQINSVIVTHSSATTQGNTLSLSTNIAQINTIIASSATVWMPLNASTNTKIGGITLNGQINSVVVTHSSITTQGNLISISTNVSQVNTIITSSNTIWLPLDASTNTKIGGITLSGQINNVVITQASVTTQGNVLSISTIAAGLNTINATSSTIWLPLDASTNTKIGGITLSGQVNSVIVAHSSLTALTSRPIAISSNNIYVGNISSINFVFTNTGDSSIIQGASSMTITISTAGGGGGGGVDTTGSTQTKTGGLNINGSMGLSTTSPGYKLDVQGIPAVANFEGIRIFNALRDDNNASSSTIVFSAKNSVGNIHARVGLMEGGVDAAASYLGFWTGSTTGGDPTLKMTITGGGSVGISSFAPTQTLDVAGNCNISGTLTKGAGSFKIPHPLYSDKWLYHGFVEAPEYGLVYRGKANLTNGATTIVLPNYFPKIASIKEMTINLTSLNGYSSLYVDTISANGNFTIKTFLGDLNQEFFWTVFSRRIDPYVMDSENKFTDSEGKMITEQNISDDIKDSLKVIRADGTEILPNQEQLTSEVNKRKTIYYGTKNYLITKKENN